MILNTETMTIQLPTCLSKYEEENENTSAKDKTNALSLLNQSYTKRLEILMNGVESFKDVKKNISEIEEINMMEKNPYLKFSSNLSQLSSPFSKR